MAAADFETLGADGDLLASFLLAHLVEASVRPVPMRIENGRKLARLALGAIQISRHVMPRPRFEDDLFDRVVIALNSAVNHRVQRWALGRHGPKSHGELR